MQKMESKWLSKPLVAANCCITVPSLMRVLGSPRPRMPWKSDVICKSALLMISSRLSDMFAFNTSYRS